MKSRLEECGVTSESLVLSVDIPLGILHAPDCGLCVVVMLVSKWAVSTD